MTEGTILAELKHVGQSMVKMDKRMEEMERTLRIVAVQATQIGNMEDSIKRLWDVRDECSRDMIAVKNWQASCPRGQIDKIERQQNETFKNQWAAIKVLAGSMLAGFTILGAFIRWAH